MIEAYGVKGMKSRPWRKMFKNAEALTRWAEANDAEVHGTREENRCDVCGDLVDERYSDGRADFTKHNAENFERHVRLNHPKEGEADAILAEHARRYGNG